MQNLLRQEDDSLSGHGDQIVSKWGAVRGWRQFGDDGCLPQQGHPQGDQEAGRGQAIEREGYPWGLQALLRSE